MTPKNGHASDQELPDVGAQRGTWFDAQPDLNPERLVQGG
jgi:hypothetical protein